MRVLCALASIGFALPVFAATPESPAPDKPKVLLQEIKPVDDKHRILVPVKVEAKIQSLVTAEIEAHVTKILKPLGSMVKAGEVVLYLENKDPGFTYAAVPVRSPVTGVISQFFTTQMSKTSRGDKLFAVIDPKSIKLSAEFPSSELSAVQTGLKGQFKLDPLKDESLPIRIVGISPLVDSRTGTASAEIEFENSKQALPPIGAIGQASFEINKGSIYMIPEASLVFQNGKPMVRILKGLSKVEKRLVMLGEQRDSAYIVKSGVSKGDKIVVRSSRPIKENDDIEVEKMAETAQ
jgi:multidrug efflux pump subunit AcrA (membrane-fusion protein)